MMMSNVYFDPRWALTYGCFPCGRFKRGHRQRDGGSGLHGHLARPYPGDAGPTEGSNAFTGFALIAALQDPLVNNGPGNLSVAASYDDSFFKCSAARVDTAFPIAAR